MNIFTVLLISTILVGLSLIGLAFNIIFRKKGKFPNTHIGGNEALKEKGIYCAKTQDKIDQIDQN